MPRIGGRVPPLFFRGSAAMRVTRRRLLIAGTASLAGAARVSAQPGRGAPRVVVVGAGFGGAVAAKQVRRLSDGAIDVTLVEREERFVSCPMSNLVIGGVRSLDDIALSYDGLARWGIRRIRDEAIAIDARARRVELARGPALPYDRLILSPGVDFVWEQIPSLVDAQAQAKVPHAWKAGPQTLELRAQIEAMPDGGLFAMHVPRLPYRCLPAPYERACLVARYFATRKKRSKVLILDANDDVTAEKSLFTAAWEGRYKGLVEYRPNSELVDVDVAKLTLKLDFEDVKASVLNVIPPQRAGAIARQLGMANANARFCQVDFLTYESTVQKDIHVLGDSIQPADLMPRSGHAATQQAKVCAAAVVALLTGREPSGEPVVASVCYSFVDDGEAGRLASVHRYDPAAATMRVEPASTVTSAPSAKEASDALRWAHDIWAEMLS